MLKKNLIMTFVAVFVAGGIAIKVLPISYEYDTTITQSKTSYKSENYIKNIALSTSYIHKNSEYKSLISFSDKIEKNFSDVVNSNEKNYEYNFETNSADINKQTHTISESMKSNNKDTNEQANIISNPEGSNSNVNIDKQTNVISESIESSNKKTSEQTNIISKSEGSNNNVNIDKQASVISEYIESNNKDTSEQTNIISKPEDSNNNVNIDKQTNTISEAKVEIPTIYYDRTTSIYANDNKTLLRVEYYLNNKLTYYSRIEQFDVTTNSYFEKIYKYDYETDTEILIRTDVYSNGNLIKSY